MAKAIVPRANNFIGPFVPPMVAKFWSVMSRLPSQNGFRRQCSWEADAGPAVAGPPGLSYTLCWSFLQEKATKAIDKKPEDYKKLIWIMVQEYDWHSNLHPHMFSLTIIQQDIYQSAQCGRPENWVDSEWIRQYLDNWYLGSIRFLDQIFFHKASLHIRHLTPLFLMAIVYICAISVLPSGGP